MGLQLSVEENKAYSLKIGHVFTMLAIDTTMGQVILSKLRTFILTIASTGCSRHTCDNEITSSI